MALFEAVKGTVVLLAGFGALSLLHRDVHALAIALVGRLHLDPNHRIPGIFIRAAANVGDMQLWVWAALAAAYAIFRFVEGYGLWKERLWAEWLAVISGGIYLPLEIYELWRRMTWVRFSALTANIVVVVFMAIVLQRSSRVKKLRETALAQASTATPSTPEASA